MKRPRRVRSGGVVLYLEGGGAEASVRATLEAEMSKRWGGVWPWILVCVWGAQAARAVPPASGPASTLEPPVPPGRGLREGHGTPVKAGEDATAPEAKPEAAPEGSPKARAEDAAARPEAPARLWAGHQVVYGKKHVAVLGMVSTRSDTFPLARATLHPDGVSIVQRPCRVTFRKTAGVVTAMRSKRPGFLPEVRVEFVGLRGGWLQALPWEVDWSGADLDEDGKPGVTVDVKSFFCSGEIWVSNRSVAVARGRFTEDRFEGLLRVRVRQTLLGASSRCLSWGITKGEDRLQGRFVYVPVPEGSTCETLLSRPWPALAAPLEE